jgi:PAT family beta-lactamase induction signal transducer AmpG
MLAIALMGFASGLPLPLTAGTLSYRLADAGLSLTEIGLFALVGLPYSLKFVWAPAVDELRVPALATLLGQRRSWILTAQIGLVIAFVGLGLTDPASLPYATAGWALALAFVSATQDIAVDAYRIEVLEEREQGAGAAATQTGYRLAMLCSAAGALALADFVAWPVVFTALAALLGLGMLGVAIGPEPGSGRVVREGEPLGVRLRRAVVEPVRDLATLPYFGVILAFAVLYKYGDAIAGVMALPFYRTLGFTGVEIASASQVPGLVASIAGVLAGGLLVARLGTIRALVWGGIAQALTNLMFVALALAGRELPLLFAAVSVDSFAGGLASSAFVAFLSGLCRPGAAATQYAVLTSLMAAGRSGLSGGSGWLAEQLGWPAFFAATTLLAAPGLLLLAWLAARGAGRPVAEEARPS